MKLKSVKLYKIFFLLKLRNDLNEKIKIVNTKTIFDIILNNMVRPCHQVRTLGS